MLSCLLSWVDPAPLGRAREVAQEELGLDQAAVVLQRGGERAAPLLGVQPPDEQARGHGPLVKGAGEAQQLIPLAADQVGLDTVAQQPAGGAVVTGAAAP